MKKNIIKSICISQVANFKMHASNNGEKPLGNQSSLKKLPDGGAYISGQMAGRAMVESYRKNIPLEKGEYVSESDSKTTCDITNDIRADIKGFMLPEDFRKRMAPISIGVVRSINNNLSSIIMDLLVNFKSNQDNSMVNREISVNDAMLFNMSIDAERVSVTDDIFNVSQATKTAKRLVVSHLPEDRRKKRVINIVKCFYFLNSFANQTRNAVNGSPNLVMIVLDPMHSRKAFDYWEGDDNVKQSIVSELNARGAKYFIGDDAKKYSKLSASEAYDQAIAYLTDESELSVIYDSIMPALDYWSQFDAALKQTKQDHKEAKAKKKEGEKVEAEAGSDKKAAKKVVAKK